VDPAGSAHASWLCLASTGVAIVGFQPLQSLLPLYTLYSTERQDKSLTAPFGTEIVQGDSSVCANHPFGHPPRSWRNQKDEDLLKDPEGGIVGISAGIFLLSHPTYKLREGTGTEKPHPLLAFRPRGISWKPHGMLRQIEESRMACSGKPHRKPQDTVRSSHTKR
jgi:hypothetical protein